jgi:hypothetical protein
VRALPAGRAHPVRRPSPAHNANGDGCQAAAPNPHKQPKRLPVRTPRPRSPHPRNVQGSPKNARTRLPAVSYIRVASADPNDAARALGAAAGTHRARRRASRTTGFRGEGVAA